MQIYEKVASAFRTAKTTGQLYAYADKHNDEIEKADDTVKLWLRNAFKYYLKRLKGEQKTMESVS